MPVRAVRLLRKMPGGAQAHLLEASDGHFYVVKFRNNPQHRRILVNEWIATAVLQQLRIQCGIPAIVELTPEFLDENTELYTQLGTRRVPAEPGWHWGSRFPGHPERLATYGTIPDPLLAKVHNRPDFLAVLVADRWLGNSDSRQAVFFRAQIREFAPGDDHPLKKGFLAWMIDHGFAFNGPYWDFPDAPLHGLYHRTCVYDQVTGLSTFEPWLEQVSAFPLEVLDKAWRSLPPEWLDSEDRDRAEWLTEQLAKRRKRIGALVEAACGARIHPFTNWK